MSYELGLDRSGNGNNWTVTNMTLAIDQMLDSPTNNFCTWNPLDSKSGDTYSEGNLKIVTVDSGDSPSRATFSVTSGKWYWEVQRIGTGSPDLAIGIMEQSEAYADLIGTTAKSWSYYSNNGNKYHGSFSSSSYGDSFGDGDIISVALDMDAGTIKFYKNGTVQDSGTAAFTSITGTIAPAISDGGAGTSTAIANFGQDSSFAGTKTAQGNQDDNSIGDFYYDVPTDYLALCTSNLPDVAVIPSEHFNTILYDDGAGAKTGVGFQPDLVWFKSRGNNYDHKLVDAVRGVTKALSTNLSAAEATDSTGLTAFGADGFTVGADTDYSDTGGGGYYGSVAGMVAYNWKANGSGSSNEEGSINTTSTSANTDAGFSISTYTGNDVDGATVGHGLNQTPDFAFVKNRDGGDSGSAGGWWLIRHVGKAAVSSVSDGQGYGFADGIFGSGQSNFNNHGIITFNSTLATLNDGDYGSVEDWWTNQSSTDYVLYCWHSVDGYSKFGSYTGNGSADGTFVYTGFKPAFVMCRRTNASLMSWRFMDTARYTYNNSSIAGVMQWNTNAQEYNVLNDDLQLDICANGFKHRHTYSQANASGEPYIYVAFAETPFKYSNAR